MLLGKKKRRNGLAVSLCRMFCSAAAVLLLCLMPVLAEENVTEATVHPAAETEDAGQTEILEDFSTEIPDGWMPATNVQKILHGFRDGVSSLYAELSHTGRETRYAVMRLYDSDMGENLLSFANLSFPVRIEGEAENYTVRLTLYSGMETYQAEALVPGGDWYVFEADIDAWTLRTAVNLCEITVETEGEAVYGFWIGSISGGGGANLRQVDAYMTFGFTAEGGEATYQDGVYLLDAGSDGSMTIVADAARTEYSTTAGRTALRIVLRNAREGGEISLAVSAAASADQEFLIASNSSLYGGENTYLLAFDETIALRAYRLSFRGLYADVGENVELVSVSLETFPETADAGDDLPGQMTKCSFSDDMCTLTVSGTLPASVVAEYIGAQIELYEIPMWESSETVFAASEPIAQMKISTRYSFAVDMSGRTDTAVMCRYAAVIRTDTACVPITPVRYPSYSTESRRSPASVTGLYASDSADVFTANASSVLVDVYVDRLLGGKSGNVSGQLYIRGGVSFCFDYSYIKQLDAEIEFYLATGTAVYLRFLCGEDLSEFGYTYPCDGAAYYTFDVSGEAGANMLCAVTEFLMKRYPDVCGLVSGERLDTAFYNGADLYDLHTYAANCARVMRLLYNSAVTVNPSICVFAPIGHTAQDAQLLETYGETLARQCDPVVLAACISWQLEQEGKISFGLLYLSDDAQEALGHMKNILAQLKAMQCSMPQESLVLWTPAVPYDAATLLEEYASCCSTAENVGVQVLFLSVEAQENMEDLYAGLKTALPDDESGRRVEIRRAEVTEEITGYTGQYALIDFANAYSTLGWRSGSGCTRIGTQASSFGGGRSLHAVFSSSDGERFTAVRGNILCVQEYAWDLTSAPYIVYSFQALTQLETTTEAELTFVFGDGNVRAEYTVCVETGKPVQVLCDLSDFAAADTVSFAAILVRCDSAVDLDMRSVTAYSRMYDTEELKTLYANRSLNMMPGTSDTVSWTPMQTVLVFGAVFGGIVVLALLSRRRESDKGEKS